MIPPDVRSEIMRRLAACEQEHGVRILFAIESGSRAWGFESPNSDYDVRFIYVRPAEWYLSVDLEYRRDVIEYEIVDDIDLNGWDIRKALGLFWKSNPGFVEWIQSPITYLNRGCFAEGVRNLLPGVYSLDKGIYHYRSMAKTNFREYLQQDMVRIKKYFYVLRPLLSVMWLERYGSVAPIEFGKLLHLIEDQEGLYSDVLELLELKRGLEEMGLAAPVPSVDAFIRTELERLELFEPSQVDRTESFTELNRLFHSVLRETDAGLFQ